MQSKTYAYRTNKCYTKFWANKLSFYFKIQRTNIAIKQKNCYDTLKVLSKVKYDWRYILDIRFGLQWYHKATRVLNYVY